MGCPWSSGNNRPLARTPRDPGHGYLRPAEMLAFLAAQK